MEQGLPFIIEEEVPEVTQKVYSSELWRVETLSSSPMGKVFPSDKRWIRYLFNLGITASKDHKESHSTPKHLIDSFIKVNGKEVF